MEKISRGKNSLKPNLAGPSQNETAVYILEIMQELGQMSKQANLSFLCYFIEMAILEAEAQAHSGASQVQ